MGFKFQHFPLLMESAGCPLLSSAPEQLTVAYSIQNVYLQNNLHDYLQNNLHVL